MRCVKSAVRCCGLSIPLVLAFVLSGCDQVGSVVDDVKSTVSGDAKVTPETTTPPEAVPAAAPQPPATNGPTPEQLVADFRKLKPSEITDSAIATLVASPEAAAEITELEIRTGQGFTGNGLSQLQAMKNLKSLAIPGAAIVAEQLSVLAQIPSLTSIQLNATKVNDTVMEQLAALPNLESLNVAATAISPASAAALARMNKLEVIDLQNTQVDDSVVQALASLPIRELNLSKTRITDASLPTIINMSTMESLNVSFTSVTGSAFKGASKMNLKVLSVGETPFGIDGFVAIKGMRSLEDLNVYRSGLVEHKSCNVFRSFPNLKTLNAGSNAITNAGLEVFFKGHRTLETLNLGNQKGITDQGLINLIGLKTLRVLNLYHTSCSAQGAAALKQKLPECKIVTNEGEF